MIGRTVLLTGRIRRFLRKHSPARCYWQWKISQTGKQVRNTMSGKLVYYFQDPTVLITNISRNYNTLHQTVRYLHYS